MELDEEVVLFPVSAALVNNGQAWQARMRGWVFRPEVDRKSRKLALATFGKLLRVDPTGQERRIFASRAGGFLVETERGRKLQVRAGMRTVALNPSSSKGAFTGTLRVSVEDAHLLSPLGNGFQIRVVTAPGDRRVFEGTVHLVAPQGVSVITDIDDTIKISEVRRQRELIENIFLKPY